MGYAACVESNRLEAIKCPLGDNVEVEVLCPPIRRERSLLPIGVCYVEPATKLSSKRFGIFGRDRRATGRCRYPTKPPDVADDDRRAVSKRLHGCLAECFAP